jgi:hypothetical protein
MLHFDVSNYKTAFLPMNFRVQISTSVDIQGDSLEGGLHYIIRDHVIIFLRKRNLVSTCLGKCGDNWIREDFEIDIPPAGDTELLDAT